MQNFELNLSEYEDLPSAIALGHATTIKDLANAIASSDYGINMPNIYVVPTAEGLPITLKTDLNGGRPDHAYRSASSFYDGRSVWIVADKFPVNTRGFDQLRRTIAHEVVGRFGMEHIVKQELGQDGWDQIRDGLLHLERTGTGSEGVQAIMMDIRRSYPEATDDVFAREALAVMAEKGIRNGLIDRVIAATRSFIRRLIPSLPLHEREIRNLVAASAGHTRRLNTMAPPSAATVVNFDERDNDLFVQAPNDGTQRPVEDAVWRLSFEDRAARLAATAIERLASDPYDAALAAYEAGRFGVAMPDALSPYPQLVEEYEAGDRDAKADAIALEQALGVLPGFDPTSEDVDFEPEDHGDEAAFTTVAVGGQRDFVPNDSHREVLMDAMTRGASLRPRIPDELWEEVREGWVRQLVVRGNDPMLTSAVREAVVWGATVGVDVPGYQWDQAREAVLTRLMHGLTQEPSLGTRPDADRHSTFDNASQVVPSADILLDAADWANANHPVVPAHIWDAMRENRVQQAVVDARDNALRIPVREIISWAVNEGRLIPKDEWHKACALQVEGLLRNLMVDSVKEPGPVFDIDDELRTGLRQTIDRPEATFSIAESNRHYRGPVGGFVLHRSYLLQEDLEAAGDHFILHPIERLPPEHERLWASHEPGEQLRLSGQNRTISYDDVGDRAVITRLSDDDALDIYIDAVAARIASWNGGTVTDLPYDLFENFPELFDSDRLRATVPATYQGKISGSDVQTDELNSLAVERDYMEIFAIDHQGQALVRFAKHYSYEDVTAERYEVLGRAEALRRADSLRAMRLADELVDPAEAELTLAGCRIEFTRNDGVIAIYDLYRGGLSNGEVLCEWGDFGQSDSEILVEGYQLARENDQRLASLERLAAEKATRKRALSPPSRREVIELPDQPQWSDDDGRSEYEQWRSEIEASVVNWDGDDISALPLQGLTYLNQLLRSSSLIETVPVEYRDGITGPREYQSDTNSLDFHSDKFEIFAVDRAGNAFVRRTEVWHYEDADAERYYVMRADDAFAAFELLKRHAAIDSTKDTDAMNEHPKIATQAQRDQAERELLQTIAEDYVLAQVRTTESRDRPVAILIAAQPGAGTPSLVSQLQDDFRHGGGFVAVDSDILSAHLPDADTAAGMRQSEPRNRLADALMQAVTTEAVRMRRNVVIEAPSVDPEKAVDLAKQLRKAGYAVEVHALAVNDQISFERATAQFERDRLYNAATKAVSHDYHDKSFYGTSTVLRRLEYAGAVDRMVIYNRLQDVIYDKPPVAGTATAVLHLEKARAQLTTFERTSLASHWDDLTQKLFGHQLEVKQRAQIQHAVARAHYTLRRSSEASSHFDLQNPSRREESRALAEKYAQRLSTAFLEANRSNAQKFPELSQAFAARDQLIAMGRAPEEVAKQLAGMLAQGQLPKVAQGNPLELEWERLKRNLKDVADSIKIVEASGMALDLRDRQELLDAQRELNDFVTRHSEVLSKSVRQEPPAPLPAAPQVASRQTVKPG